MPAATLQRYRSFKNYWTFDAFDAELTRQLSAGYWVAVAPPAGHRLPAQAAAYYQPHGAAQVWALSEPDNAWRGYFLPLEEAVAYQQQLGRRDGRFRLVVLVLLAGAGICLLCYWLH